MLCSLSWCLPSFFTNPPFSSCPRHTLTATCISDLSHDHTHLDQKATVQVFNTDRVMCCTPSPPLPPISSSPCLPCPSSQNTVKMMVHVREADVYLTRFILRYVNTRLTLSNGKITAYQNSRRGTSDGSICKTFILSVNPKERVIRLVYMAYNGYASNFTLLYFTNCVNPKYTITQNKLLFHRFFLCLYFKFYW